MKCPECGHDHPASSPHDAKTMQYQFRFQQMHGRLPTHEDAMAHCSEGDKEMMRRILKAYGIDSRDVADLSWNVKKAG